MSNLDAVRAVTLVINTITLVLITANLFRSLKPRKPTYFTRRECRDEIERLQTLMKEIPE